MSGPARAAFAGDDRLAALAAAVERARRQAHESVRAAFAAPAYALNHAHARIGQR